MYISKLQKLLGARAKTTTINKLKIINNKITELKTEKEPGQEVGRNLEKLLEGR